MSDMTEIIRRFDQVSVNRHFQWKLLSVSAGEAVVQMEMKPEYLQETNVIHGGLVSAVADTAAVYCFWPNLENRKMASIEFKVNFLRPAVVDRGPLEARAKVIRHGHRIGVCDVEVFQQSRIVAKGIFTYMFFQSSE